MNHKIELACIIDDDKIYVNLVKKIIEMKHLCENLLIFKNGREALNHFEVLLENLENEKIPDIIFLDLNMPIMDGWEFLQQFTAIKNSFGKVITLYVISSSINPVDIDRAKSIQEVHDYIIKPITIKDLETIFMKNS